MLHLLIKGMWAALLRVISGVSESQYLTEEVFYNKLKYLASQTV